MRLDATTLALMDDEHLIASVHAAYDSLTSTPIEVELLARFERALDEIADLTNTTTEEQDE